jgi:hypothetical protein
MAPAPAALALAPAAAAIIVLVEVDMPDAAEAAVPGLPAAPPTAGAVTGLAAPVAVDDAAPEPAPPAGFVLLAVMGAAIVDVAPLLEAG